MADGTLIECHEGQVILLGKPLMRSHAVPADTDDLHILLPKGKKCGMLLVNNKQTSFDTELVGNSLYLNFSCFADRKASFEILFSDQLKNEG